MKTSSKHFDLVIGPRARQHEPKWPYNYFTYDVSQKKSANPRQKNFFECNVLDWPIRLSSWTAL